MNSKDIKTGIAALPVAPNSPRQQLIEDIAFLLARHWLKQQQGNNDDAGTNSSPDLSSVAKQRSKKPRPKPNPPR